MTDTMDRIRAIGQRLKKEYHAERVILFGSYAAGQATEDSDVDLLVIAPTSEPFLQRRAMVKRLIRDLRNGLAVAPIVLTSQEIEKQVRLRDPFILNVLEEGVEL
jgi:predicted nucleotidyltransferase